MKLQFAPILQMLKDANRFQRQINCGGDDDDAEDYDPDGGDEDDKILVDPPC